MAEINNDIELFFEYHKKIMEMNKGKTYASEYVDDKGNITTSRHMLYCFALEYYNKNNFPIVVPDNIYKKICVPEYYHGFRDIEHAGAFLTDFGGHYGYGSSIHGYYLANEKREALGYTVPEENDQDFFRFLFRSKSRILKVKPTIEKVITNKELNYVFKIFEDLVYKRKYKNITEFLNDNESVRKVIKNKPHIRNLLLDSKKVNDLISFARANNVKYCTISSKDTKESWFMYDFITNKALMAIYFGFDAILVDNDESILALLDKAKHVVSESEAKRILSLTDGYKDAVLNYDENFEVKNDEYFLFNEKLAGKTKEMSK